MINLRRRGFLFGAGATVIIPPVRTYYDMFVPQPALFVDFDFVRNSIGFGFDPQMIYDWGRDDARRGLTATDDELSAVADLLRDRADLIMEVEAYGRSIQDKRLDRLGGRPSQGGRPGQAPALDGDAPAVRQAEHPAGRGGARPRALLLRAG